VKKEERKLLGRYRSGILGVLPFIVIFIAWETLGQLGVINPLFFSWPSEILLSFSEILASGKLWTHLSVSMYELVMGFSVAFILSVPVGLVMGRSKIVANLLDPFVSALYAMPRIALMPLIILMFGIGLRSKIVLVFFGSFFPILINSYQGSKTVDSLLIDVARIFGARGLTLYTKIILPAMVPYLVAGLRLGLGVGLIMVVVGEFYAANQGVGYMIAFEASMFNAGAVMAWTLMISILGILLTESVKYIERKVVKKS
jgi:NitT/TauT family transport system permease protein